ncbi:MAG: hypothetical protein ACK4X2_07130 [Bacteroidota bacterium]
MITPKLFAQTTSNGIFFQAIARDNFSNPAKDRKIYVQSSIIQTTATGTKVLTEEYQTTTDVTGVFTISIGQGTRIGGTANNLTGIDWANGPYYLNLKVAITPVAPTTSWNYKNEWIDLGSTPFGVVPYALYAGTANGLDGKLSIKDTTSMLAIYAKAQAVKSLESTVNTKVGVTDTAAMLAPYRKMVNEIIASNITSLTADAINAALNSKVNIADSNKMYVTPSLLAARAFDPTSINNSLALKANSSDVNTSLALKANASDISTSLGLKANAADVTTSLASKVDKVTGKELSTNDYTTAEKTKLAAISGTNTGDQDLSLLATAASVLLKANATDVTTDLALKASSLELTSGLATKVDKVAGKNLSTNDYTTAEKTKLAAISGTNTGDQDLRAYATTANVTTSLALKANASDISTSLALKENISNKSTAVDLGGTTPSDILFPTQKAVKDYVAANNSGGGVADGGITTIKLADGAVTDEKINTVSGSKVIGNITGNAATATLAATATSAGNITATSNTTLTSLSSLTGVGTITTGTWSGTAVAIAKGGTGLTATGTDGQILTSTNTGTLTWTTATAAKFTNDVTIKLSGSKSLGKYANGATIPTAGKTLDQFLLDLVQETVAPTYTAPTVSISSTQSGSYEIGTNINVTLSNTFTQNNGGSATGTTYYKNSVSLGTGVSTNNHGVLSTSISYSVTVTYGAGTTILNNNLGTPDATGQIPAGSKSSSLTISPFAYKYWGSSVSNAIDDATLRAGTNENSGKAKSSFTIPISGSKYIFYAYPASLGVLSSISVGGFDSFDTFTKTTRDVTNASGYTQSYNIYISNNRFTVDVSNIIIN